MQKNARRLLALLALALPQAGEVAGTDSAPVVARCELSGTVDAGSAAYLVDCIERAQQSGNEALLVQVDTPGGSLESTRIIVSAFLRSRLPILVWVGPAGARAGSAGVFVTLAAHVAAMAPATNIGAAHPVDVGGGDPESAGKHMAQKIENDTAAWAESIAHQRGRNETWATQAVRESASLTAENAVKSKVVDFLAASESEVLSKADGRKVTTSEGEHVLRTRSAKVNPLQPTLGQRFVHLLASPSLAYLLFMVGGLGIVIELSHPGMIAPGIVGAACVVLALVAFSALPIRAGAVILLVLGIGMIFAELFVGHGILAVGGAVFLALGGILLIDRYNPRWYVEPSFGLPLVWILPVVVGVAGAAIFVVVRAAQARRMPQRGGDIGLIGEVGKALTAVSEQGGEVFVHGERWQAVSEKPIPEGGPVVVRSVRGLTLQVEEKPWK